MLEVVGIEFAGVQSHVGLHVVGVFNDLEVMALSLHQGHSGLEDLGMRSGRSTDFDFSGIGIDSNATDGGGQEGRKENGTDFHKNL